MNSERNKTMKNWISVTISVVAFVISIFALAIVIPMDSSKDGMDFDYIGAIIGVLSFLVTLLIGYQIYTVINVKEELKEVRRIKDQIETKIQIKSEAITNEYKDELKLAAPLLMALASGHKELIEKEVFKSYLKSKPNQLSKELAGASISMIVGEAASQTDNNVRKQRLEELARNVQYEEVVEFYTDHAKSKEHRKIEGMDSFLLELIGLLADKQNEKDTK